MQAGGAAASANSVAKPHKPARPAEDQCSALWLNFPEGKANSITVMEAFQGEGKHLFHWGETGTAIKRVASLCNSTEAFQGPNSEQLLTVSTLQKKLADWLSFFGPGLDQEKGMTASGTGVLGLRSTAMIHMEDMMRIIVEHKSLAKEHSPGQGAPGLQLHEAAAAKHRSSKQRP